MGAAKFMRPNHGGGAKLPKSPNLYVANCGPAVGLSFDAIAAAFSQFGLVTGVYAADDSGTRVIVSFSGEDCAESAFTAFHGRPCAQLGGRFLNIQYSVPRPQPKVRGHDSLDVGLTAKDLNIPGLYLFIDFITPKEEELILGLGYIWQKGEFSIMDLSFVIKTRNVDTTKRLGELPSFVSPVLEKISACTELKHAATINLDQLTVNEYPPGVGLSPHIDTHSAFEDEIFSLSLAGPCIMEFRRYLDGSCQPDSSMSNDVSEEHPENSTNLLRKALYLPPRSLLLLSGEARYAWLHYIPHHKVDNVKDNLIRRASRRVSFTLRKVRRGPCRCAYVEYCDSQS